MRIFRGFLMLLPVLSLTFVGCDSDFWSNLPGPRQILAGRGTAAGVRRLDAVLRGIEDVASATGEPGPLPEGLEYDPDTGAFSVEIDTTKDGFADSTLSGILSSAANTSDGIDPGESATVVWFVVGEVDGAGTFQLVGLAPGHYAATGAGTLSDPVEFEFDMSSIDVVLEDSPYPLDGTIDYETRATGLIPDPFSGEVDLETATMDGDLDFFGTERATGTGEFEGEDLTFDVKLDTFQVVFTL